MSAVHRVVCPLAPAVSRRVHSPAAWQSVSRRSFSAAAAADGSGSGSGSASPFSFPSSSPAAYHLLVYRYVDDMLTRRTPVRPLHLAHAQPYVERGQLLLGGACPPELKDAYLAFHATREEVEQFARNDPYVQKQLVETWKVQPWAVVIGSAMRAKQ